MSEQGLTAKRLAQIDLFLDGPHKRAFHGQAYLRDMRAEVNRVRAELEAAKAAGWLKDAEIVRLRTEADKLRKWANCGGVPIGKKCSVDGHEIYGPFHSKADGSGVMCEFHSMKDCIEKQDAEIAEMRRDKERLDWITNQQEMDIWVCSDPGKIALCPNDQFGIDSEGRPFGEQVFKGMLREAIDAAMKPTPASTVEREQPDCAENDATARYITELGEGGANG